GLIIVLAVMVWGLIDEATQPIFGRVFDWNDYAANTLGVGIGLSLLVVGARLRKQVESGKNLGTSRPLDLGVDAPVVP
ncbi:MAG: VanZ family protein, partial [Planctomycetales bacterium]